MKYLLGLVVILMMSGCGPHEDVVFKRVNNVQFDLADKTPVLKATIVFYNPNKGNAKLKKVNMKIFLSDKLAGTIDQTLNQNIKGESEFSVPIEVKLSMKEINLFDTVINLFGGKKYDVRMTGKVRVSVHGFAVSVPVDYKDQLRIR